MQATHPSCKQFAIAYVVVLLVMAVLDAIWLGWLGIGFYRQEIGPLLLDTPNWLPAGLFYFLYPLGLVYLALHIRPQSLGEAVVRSAVVGLVAYGVYDLSNLATLRDWSVKVCLVDMAYGTCASALAGFLAFKTARKFGRRFAV